jgi:hypothetical protein
MAERERNRNATKLTTLEKSKLDWNQFVSREGLTEDLQQHGKDGFLDKADFLKRAAEREQEELDRQRKKAQRKF